VCSTVLSCDYDDSYTNSTIEGIPVKEDVGLIS